MISLKKENTSKLVKTMVFLYLALAVAFYGSPELTIYPQVLGVLLTCIFFVNIGIRKVSLNFSVPIKMFAIFILLMLLGTMFVSTSWSFFFTTFQVFILLFILSNILIMSNSHEFYYWGFIVGGLIAIIMQVIEGRPLLGIGINLVERVGGTIGNVNDYAFVLGTGVNFLFFSFYDTGKKKKTFFWKNIKLIIILLFLVECVFFTGSKSGIIMMAFSFLVFIILKLKRISLMKKFLTGIVAITLLSVITPKSINIDAVVFERFQSMYDLATGVSMYSDSYEDTSTTQRADLIIDGIRLWSERPILGWGPNEFRYINKVDDDTYSHNNFIEILVNFGLLGFIIFYFSHFYLLRKLLKLKKMKQRKDEVNWLLLMLFSLLIIDMTFVTYYNKIYFINLAFILANTKKLENYFKIKRVVHTNLS